MLSISSRIDLWAQRHHEPTPVHGWSTSLSIDALLLSTDEKSNSSDTSIRERELARYWRNLDSVGVTLDEYLHTLNAVGIRESYSLFTRYSIYPLLGCERLSEILAIVRSRNIPDNSALIISLFAISRDSVENPRDIGNEIDSSIDMEWFWYVVNTIGKEEYTRMSNAGVPVWLMVRASDYDIDADLISSLAG